MIPSVDDILEIAIIGEFDGTEETVNVAQFNVVAMTAASESELVSTLRQLVEQILDIWESFATLHQVWKRFRWRNLTTGSPSTTVELAADHPGVISGDSEPPGVCMLLGFYTSEAGVTLRKFVGPVAQSRMDPNGELNAAAVIAGAAAINVFLANQVFTLGTFRYGHISGITTAWLEPTSGYVPTEPAYQRRRKRGKGS